MWTSRMSLNKKWFNRFGMGKFAAVMWVIKEAFGNEECLLELEMRNEKLGIERECPRIDRELKEIGPQADGGCDE